MRYLEQVSCVAYLNPSGDKISSHHTQNPMLILCQSLIIVLVV